MPLYIDVHDLKGVKAEDVAKAHAEDVRVQAQHGVEYMKYWVNEERGKVFCLVHAPDAETANRVHREAHGLLAGRILQVEPEVADALMGGGGVMAAFASAACAVRCAMRIQAELARRNELRNSHGVKLRIGAAAGEPVEREGDFFGSTVQLAARLCAHAEPEQILVSNAVVELCIGTGLKFQDIGELNLKGFEQGVRAHAVAL